MDIKKKIKVRYFEDDILYLHPEIDLPNLQTAIERTINDSKHPIGIYDRRMMLGLAIGVDSCKLDEAELDLNCIFMYRVKYQQYEIQIAILDIYEENGEQKIIVNIPGIYVK